MERHGVPGNWEVARPAGLRRRRVVHADDRRARWRDRPTRIVAWRRCATRRRSGSTACRSPRLPAAARGGGRGAPAGAPGAARAPRQSLNLAAVARAAAHRATPIPAGALRAGPEHDHGARQEHAGRGRIRRRAPADMYPGGGPGAHAARRHVEIPRRAFGEHRRALLEAWRARRACGVHGRRRPDQCGGRGAAHGHRRP